jgi:hypothetical protein
VTYLARLKAKIRENSAPEQLTKPTKPNSTSSVGSVGALRTRFLCGEPHGTEIEERKAMAMGGVPEAYLDGWARLQCQRPATVSDDEWRQAIVDAGLFLDQWGGMAVELGWTPADLFDPPSEGNPGGLVWRIRGQGIRALGTCGNK